ncbi:MAG: hypothetical protein RSE07_04375 [Oscillospiraceae bacterium]
MKIIKEVENWVFDNETKLSGVDGTRDEIVADVPFKLDSIKYKEIDIDGGEFISLPYFDEELKDDVESLALDIAGNEYWVYPNYNNIKVSIEINLDSNVFKASLCVDVQPPKYTEEEKTSILANSSREKLFSNTNDTEYSLWEDIFESAEAFYNNGDLGSLELYDIEFTAEEQNELQWFLIRHLEMVLSGNSDLN